MKKSVGPKCGPVLKEIFRKGGNGDRPALEKELRGEFDTLR